MLMKRFVPSTITNFVKTGTCLFWQMQITFRIEQRDGVALVIFLLNPMPLFLFYPNFTKIINNIINNKEKLYNITDIFPYIPK